MDKKQAEELIQVIRDLVEVLKPKPLPTLDQAVEAQVKNLILDLGTSEVFDKIGHGDRQALDSLINREKALIAGKTQDIIEKVFSDKDYETEKQQEINRAVEKALKEKEESEKKE